MTTILGIVNITEDSFSDGGKYLAADAAIAHARALADADVLDLGGAASNPDSAPVAPNIEIARLDPVIAALRADKRSISVDSFSTPVQRWALSQNVEYLNDIQGFIDTAFYPELARSNAKLIVMHSVQGRSRATRVDVPAASIFGRVETFFRDRIAALTAAGVDRSRLILDPGMGFFLGTNPEASFEMLRRVTELKSVFKLPVLISVSRKSFLRAVAGRSAAEAGPASLAAEIFAIRQGADYIRTHNPAALRDALRVTEKFGETRP
jgi:dihydropteroate synthase type 2